MKRVDLIASAYLTAYLLGAAIAIITVGYEPSPWFVALAFVVLALASAVWFLACLTDYLNERLDRKLEQRRL